jgi:peptidyl-prolyl cis-trans isomerase C
MEGKMKSLIIGLLMVIVPFVSVSASDVDPSAVLADWDGGSITAGEYISWWQSLPQDDRQPLTILDAKMEFLNNMINVELILQAADSVGISKRPRVGNFLAKRRKNLLKTKMQEVSIEGRIHIDEAKVEEIYRKRQTEIEARQIIVRTLDEANALLDSIKAGVPFEDLARRHSTCASGARGGEVGKMRYGDFTEVWSQMAMRLQPGEVSEPFPAEGQYCIVKVDSKQVVGSDNPEAEKAKIRARLRRDAIFDETYAFLDSLKIAYDYNLDVDAVVGLCARYADALRDLGEVGTVVAADVVPPMTESEKEIPLATYRGGLYTYGNCADRILATRYVLRPRLDDPDDMISFVTKHIGDTLLVMEAEKLGMDRLPEILQDLEKARKRRTVRAFFELQIAEDAEVPEEVARAFYETYKEDFVHQAGHRASKIVVGTREAADSVMERLSRGESFEEIAKVRSRDPFTAPYGGDMGFYAVGRDVEFDGFFEVMEEGETGIFRSLEGFVVLWLRERREARQATFEESHDSINNKLIEKYKDDLLQTWLQNQRKGRRVRIDKSALERVDLTL